MNLMFIYRKQINIIIISIKLKDNLYGWLIFLKSSEMMDVYSSSVDISYFKLINNTILFESTDHVTWVEYRYYRSFVSIIISEY